MGFGKTVFVEFLFGDYFLDFGKRAFHEDAFASVGLFTGFYYVDVFWLKLFLGLGFIRKIIFVILVIFH